MKSKTLKGALDIIRRQTVEALTGLLPENPDKGYKRPDDLRITYPFCLYRKDDNWTVDAEKVLGIRPEGYHDVVVIIGSDGGSDWNVPPSEIDIDALLHLLDELETNPIRENL